MSGYVPGRRCDVCGGESPRVPTCGECETAQRYDARVEALQALCREAAEYIDPMGWEHGTEEERALVQRLRAAGGGT